MDDFLPETLLNIMEAIGKKNICNGYKICSSGKKTNIVIHFLELSNMQNIQSGETFGSEHNNTVQLKSSCLAKHRSPCNQSRDLKRTQQHDIVKDTSFKDSSVLQSNLDCTNSTLGSSLEHDNPDLQLETEECKQSQHTEIEEEESESSSTLDCIGAAKSKSKQDDELVSQNDAEHMVANLDNGEDHDKTSNDNFCTRNRRYNNYSKTTGWHKPRYQGNQWEQFPYQPFGRQRPYPIPKHASPQLRASLQEIHDNMARAHAQRAQTNDT